MAELTLSEAKFQLEDFLMTKLGLSAGTYLDLVNESKNKLTLSKNLYSITQQLESKGKVEVSKALSNLWNNLRKDLIE